MPGRRHSAPTRQQLASLSVVGLTTDQQEVYFALLAHPHSRPSEIAERCHKPVSDITRTLRELAAEGLSVRSAGQATTYQAVSPQAALHGRVTEAAQTVENARRTVSDLEHLFQRAVHTAHPATRVEVISGASQIAARARQLEDDARMQLRTFDTPPYVIDLDGPDEPLNFGVRRDIAYRCIYDHDALAIPGRFENDVLRNVAAGQQARTTTRLPVKMVIFDDLGALLPTALHSDVLDSAYFIGPCPMLDALIALFEMTWLNAVPATTSTSAATEDSTHRELLALLLAGHTDSSIAKVLSISPRTAQRRVQQLLTELGATTRFQAGAAAALRGWFDG